MNKSILFLMVFLTANVLAVPVPDEGMTLFSNSQFQQAAQAWERAAAAGNGNAQYQLGIMLLDGRHIPKDLEKALGYLQSASDAEVGRATLALYFLSRPNPRAALSPESLYLLNKAAQQGDNIAVQIANGIAMMANMESLPKIISLQEENIVPLGKSNRASARVSTESLLRGKLIYQESCMACHSTGIAGSPKIGDRNVWKQREKKGFSALLKNTIYGINAHPEKGGGNYSDEQLEDALNYMLTYKSK